MAITLDEFRTKYEPDSGEMQFLYNGNEIIAVIISTLTCDNESVVTTLQTMTSVQFIIDGVNYTSTIEERLDRGTYFFFEITPITVPSFTNTESCAVAIYASDDNSRIFTNSEYNPIAGNATEPQTVGYIYEVDRKRSQVRPTNIENILAQAAQNAEIQLSNYSDTGLKRSKYDGTKTDQSEFGVVPAIAGKAFQGANYPIGTETTLICSLLYSSTFEEGNTENDFFIQRSVNTNSIDEFLFTINPKLNITPGNSNIPQIRTQLLPITINTFDSSPITDEVKAFNYSGPDIINIGDVLKLDTDGSIEYIKVLSVFPQTKTFTCLRGYREEVPGGFPAISHEDPLVTKVVGDVVYKIQNNGVYKLSDSLIGVAANEKIFYIDQDGSLLLEVRDCKLPE